MRKLIASLLAGATVLSMASMASFAADATSATITLNLEGASHTPGDNGHTYTLEFDGEKVVTSDAANETAQQDATKIAGLFNGKTATYKTKQFDVTVAGTTLTLTAKEKGALPGSVTDPNNAELKCNDQATTAQPTTKDPTYTNGTAATVDNVKAVGNNKVTAKQGEQVTLTAKVYSDNGSQNEMAGENINWSLQGATGNTKFDGTADTKTVTSNTAVTLHIDPAQAVSADGLKVIATAANGGTPETFTINVTAKGPVVDNNVSTIEVTGSATVTQGQKDVVYTATPKNAAGQLVSGKAITWTVEGKTSNGTSITDGKLTIGADETAGNENLTVKATAEGKEGTMKVSVTAAPKPGATSALVMTDGDGKTVSNDLLPNKTYYVNLNNVIAGVDGSDLVDKDMFKVDIKKAQGSSIIKNITLAEEKVNGVRTPVIKIQTKEVFDDKETKVVLETTITPKKDALKKYTFLKDEKMPMSDLKFFVKNAEDNGDQDYMAGTGGVVVTPTENEDNEIVWADENRDVARLTFEADSDAGNFYPKLSTKWDSKYNDLVGNADAFLFDFVGNPSISSTSRATLELYNPFVNNDGEYTINVKDLRIYMINDNATLGANTEEALAALADGRVVEVTDTAKLGTNEDGDQVITLRTRTLGKYIITDGTALLDQAADEEVVETEEPSTEKPVDGTKPNPGTGF